MIYQIYLAGVIICLICSYIIIVNDDDETNFVEIVYFIIVAALWPVIVPFLAIKKRRRK